MRVRAAAKLHPAGLYIFDLLAAEERPFGRGPAAREKKCSATMAVPERAAKEG
jgi:hypothetical protein